MRIPEGILAFIAWAVLLLALLVVASALGFSGVGPGETWIMNVLAVLILVLIALVTYLRSRASRS
ncbi:MAG: DUF1328 domain-containing protein [Desulfomonilia bacterium]